MDRQYIEQHLVIDRYLKDALDDRELAEFEERLAWDSGLLDEVELARSLREGLRAEVGSGDYTASVRTSLRDRVMQFLWLPQYAAAASFLIGVALATLLVSNVSGPDLGSAGATGRTELVPLDVLRGTGTPVITIHRDTWTVLLVDVPDAGDSYRATVTTGEVPWKTIAVQSDLVPSFAKSIAVGIPANQLEAGPYLLTLERRSGAGEPDSYELVQQIPFETALPK